MLLLLLIFFISSTIFMAWYYYVEKKEVERLKTQNALYSTLIQNAPIGIAIVDTEITKSVIETNIRHYENLNLTREEIIKGNMVTLSPEFQSEGVSSSEKLSQIMKEYRKNFDPILFEWTFQTKDNRPFHTRILAAPIDGSKEHPMSMFIIEDINSIRNTEEVVYEQLLQLDKKNQELEKYIKSQMQLENFAYMASHDLKTPLRNIVGFSQILYKDLKPSLNSDQIDYFEILISSTQNMHQLIEDLLSYAKIDSKIDKKKEFDLNILLYEILSEHKIEIKEKKAEIIYKDLPKNINADRSQIKQLFQNLISNSLKFCKDKAPVLQIEKKETATHWHFSVSDNGIGIEDEFKEKIFLIFRRLHTKEQFEGTGIGLAICKKIVENHDGEIWLDTTYDQGSKFDFTIIK